jgi:hypothetical protein
MSARTPESYLLRFIGGPCDGLEEVSSSAQERLLRSPSVSEMVRAMETADPGQEMPDFSAEYRLVSLDRAREIAEYRPAR